MSLSHPDGCEQLSCIFIYGFIKVRMSQVVAKELDAGRTVPDSCRATAISALACNFSVSFSFNKT